MSCAAKTILTPQINDGETQIAVSVDGTWQKRYGHNSLLGATFVLSIDNGCVLDYPIKSKICYLCKKNRHPTIEWTQKHAAVCQINHRGSSGNMEKGRSKCLCVLSININLKYTTFVGAVLKALQEKFGNEYTVTKEDCIGHISVLRILTWSGSSLFYSIVFLRQLDI